MFSFKYLDAHFQSNSIGILRKLKMLDAISGEDNSTSLRGYNKGKDNGNMIIFYHNIRVKKQKESF